MAMLLRQCVVLHTPKTGCVWRKLAMSRAGVPWVEVGESHIDRACLRQVLPDHPMIAFVRHPAAWLQSFWRFGCVRGAEWRQRMAADPLQPMGGFPGLQFETFEAFIRDYLDHDPGGVGRLFERFTGLVDDPVSFIGRQETLIDDLVQALHRFGAEFDAAVLRAEPVTHHTNANLKLVRGSQYTPALHAAVLQAEAATIERYGYNAAGVMP